MDKTAFGNFIADLRNEKGLTQEQLSVLLNVNYKTISKWECGNSLPDLETMIKLAEIFNISLYELSKCKKIKNSFISRNMINKIINKDSLKKMIILKIILLFLIVILLFFTIYSYIYTINNYGQMEVYELVSEDENLFIEGLFIKSHNNYYLSINKVQLFNSTDDFLNDKIKSLKYSITINNTLIQINHIDFDHYTTVKNAFSAIELHNSKQNLSFIKNDAYFTIYYTDTNINNITKTFKIKLSIKESNNKLFY